MPSPICRDCSSTRGTDGSHSGRPGLPGVSISPAISIWCRRIGWSRQRLGAFNVGAAAHGVPALSPLADAATRRGDYRRQQYRFGRTNVAIYQVPHAAPAANSWPTESCKGKAGACTTCRNRGLDLCGGATRTCAAELHVPVRRSYTRPILIYPVLVFFIVIVLRHAWEELIPAGRGG